MNSQDGNFYTYTTTDIGIPTFIHVATGETLHAQAGPYQEAWNLYVVPSKLLERKTPAVVYDCGTGCASQVIAARDAFEKNVDLPELHVISFDLEKNGLKILLEHIDKFEFAKPHLDFIRAAVKSNHVIEALPDGRTFTWTFIEGDFEQKIKECEDLPKANIIYYDFFSPKNIPNLWTYRVLKDVYQKADTDCVLVTYSSATRIKGALGAAGFYLGYGIPSGKKEKTTFAAVKKEDLEDPIAESWIKTYVASHLRFVDSENEEDRKASFEKMLNHPQFKNFPLDEKLILESP